MPISKEAQRLDDMMRKVEGLLVKADSTDHPLEADSLRAAAERIMIKYKIEQEDLIARGDLRVDGINIMFKDIAAYSWTSEFGSTYQSLLSYALHHAGAMGVWSGGYGEESRVLTMIGYEADIRYAEALFINARLVFADRMEPQFDVTMSDEDNVYRMRNAGMERGRIGEAMGWGDRAHQRVTRVYKKACAARDEEAIITGRSVNVKDYRSAYADGFKNEFWSRLSIARLAVENEIKEGGMVLHGREERVKEAMYERWPSLRPDTTPTKINKQVVKSPRTSRWTKADQARYERSLNTASSMGRTQGAKAASEIDVSINNTPRKRIN